MIAKGLFAQQLQDELSMFKCDRCSYSTKYTAHLEDHQNVVHEGVIIGCPVEGCSSRFTNRSNIGDHIKRMHHEKTFKCLECDYVAKTQRTLRVHFGLHHGVKYFACEFCDFKAGFQFVISRHTRKKHAGELTEDQQKSLNIQTCQNCGFKSNKSKITEHLKDGCNRDSYYKKGKPTSNPLTCEKCDYVTEYKGNLRKHRKLHENNSYSFVPRKGNKRESRAPDKGKGNGKDTVLNHNQTSTENKPQMKEYYEEIISPIKTEKVCDPQLEKTNKKAPNNGNGKCPVPKKEEVQEYYEEIISPIKNEQLCDPKTEDISGDEDDTMILQNGLSLKIKTEQLQYLCPISSCTFTTLEETVRLLHLKSSHGLSKDLPFLKMVL